MFAEATIAAALDKRFELEEGVLAYKWDDLVVTWGLPDRLLALMYERFAREGILELVYHEGPKSLMGFLKDSLDPKTYTLGAFVLEDGRPEIAGLGWLNHFTPVGQFLRADVGHAFFREHWKGNRAKRLASMMLEWFWDNVQVDAVGGITPAENRAAVIFAAKLGFHLAGPFPAGCDWHGRLAPAYLSTLTREMWAAKRPWKES
jgi:RimJ/RimL family protein N-acetyltransferase